MVSLPAQKQSLPQIARPTEAAGPVPCGRRSAPLTLSAGPCTFPSCRRRGVARPALRGRLHGWHPCTAQGADGTCGATAGSSRAVAAAGGALGGGGGSESSPWERPRPTRLPSADRRGCPVPSAGAEGDQGEEGEGREGAQVLPGRRHSGQGADSLHTQFPTPAAASPAAADAPVLTAAASIAAAVPVARRRAHAGPSRHAQVPSERAAASRGVAKLRKSISLGKI